MKKIILPKRVDKTPGGAIVRRAEIGESGYTNNIECELEVKELKNGDVEIIYYAEDGTFLTAEQIAHIIKNSKKLCKPTSLTSKPK